MKGIFKVILFCLLVIPLEGFANNDSLIVEEPILLEDSVIGEQEYNPKRKNVRAKAIIFTVLTGPLGGHRVYLGTRPGAPVIYAVTLGGFGLLPLIDLAHLIFKKDISSFEKNPKIMMWNK